MSTAPGRQLEERDREKESGWRGWAHTHTHIHARCMTDQPVDRRASPTQY